jgi:hypothetical protein
MFFTRRRADIGEDRTDDRLRSLAAPAAALDGADATEVEQRLRNMVYGRSVARPGEAAPRPAG